mgnify:CR=1 FL=1
MAQILLTIGLFVFLLFLTHIIIRYILDYDNDVESYLISLLVAVISIAGFLIIFLLYLISVELIKLF